MNKSLDNPKTTRKLHCCCCDNTVSARLTYGVEIYPHRKDLSALPFWRCDDCGNYVGCHHKTDNPTRPLGCIPTPEIRSARQHVHRILDPLWKKGPWKRDRLYQEIAAHMGTKDFHTSEIKSVEEARKVYRFIITIPVQANSFSKGPS